MSHFDVEGMGFLDEGPIDVTVESAECVALFGASGAGEFLLLRAIADLDLHDGVACLDGRKAYRRFASFPRRSMAGVTDSIVELKTDKR